VLEVMRANVALAQRVLRRFLASLPRRRSASPIDTALEHAIMTAPAQRDPVLVAKLGAVAGRVLQ
jgi:5'-methylthioadenosine phosphorylase